MHTSRSDRGPVVPWFPLLVAGTLTNAGWKQAREVALRGGEGLFEVDTTNGPLELTPNLCRSLVERVEQLVAALDDAEVRELRKVAKRRRLKGWPHQKAARQRLARLGLLEMFDGDRRCTPLGFTASILSNERGRRARMGIVAAALLGLLGGLAQGCDMPTFYCEGPHPSLEGEQLCFCKADGVLCGHSGFGSCVECPVGGER